MLEKDIERNVCNYAKANGCNVWKFTSPARRSVPDRLFQTKEGRFFFIEFKAPGKKPTEGQEREMARIRNNRGEVFVVDNVFEGRRIVGLMCLGIEVAEYVPVT